MVFVEGVIIPPAAWGRNPAPPGLYSFLTCALASAFALGYIAN